MFEDDKHIESDILMRSILSEAEEEVPAHIWEGVSSELDRIEGIRTVKPVRLWFRRSAIAVAAAAAVAVGVFVDWNGSDEFVPSAGKRDMIAVVPHDRVEISTFLPEAAGLHDLKLREITADAEDDVAKAMEIVEKQIVEQQENQSTSETIVSKPAETESEAKEYFPEIWPDEADEEGRRQRISLVVSGLAGSNGTQKSASGVIKRPTMSTAKPVTGVVQKSTESTYGLPVSLGAGVKIGLSPRWSLGVGANYSLLVRKFFGTYTLVNEAGEVEHSVTSDVRNTQRYLGIPVNAFYNILESDNVSFYAYAGGTVERCFSDSYDILSTDFIHKQKTQGVQLSANAGIGVEFMFGNHLGLYLDPSIRYYFDCKQPKSIRTAQPLMIGIEAGLRFKL